MSSRGVSTVFEGCDLLCSNVNECEYGESQCGTSTSPASGTSRRRGPGRKHLCFPMSGFSRRCGNYVPGLGQQLAVRVLQPSHERDLVRLPRQLIWCRLAREAEHDELVRAYGCAVVHAQMRGRGHVPAQIHESLYATRQLRLKVRRTGKTYEAREVLVEQRRDEPAVHDARVPAHVVAHMHHDDARAPVLALAHEWWYGDLLAPEERGRDQAVRVSRVRRLERARLAPQVALP